MFLQIPNFTGRCASFQQKPNSSEVYCWQINSPWKKQQLMEMITLTQYIVILYVGYDSIVVGKTHELLD